jgi:predicted lipase
MQKTYDQLQAALERELAYSKKLNSQIDRLREQLRNTISIQEHEKILTAVRQEYESKMTKIKNQQSTAHNPRGAGRKKKATEQMIMRVRELRAAGFSQQAIADTVSKEFGIAISRTTVGEIVRGEHKK